MKRFLSLLAAVLMLSSFAGCCCSGMHGGGWNQGSYYQPPYNYGGGACPPGGACGVPGQAPLYPSGSLYGPTTATPPGQVAGYPYVPQTAFAPMQTFPTF